MRQPISRLFSAILLIGCLTGCQSASTNAMASAENNAHKGRLIYHNPMNAPEAVADWIMEGPGEVTFSDGWMRMYSPDQAMHHVFWAPVQLPDSFVAEWQAQSLNDEAGLGIVFFAAKGENGENIFDPALPARDGTFTQYTEGAIRSYHISYYANAAHNPDRGHANLRKNNTFSLLQQGQVGIPTDSTKVHQIRLIKRQAHIQLYVDDRLVIDYTDNQPVVDGVDTGPALTNGWLGFRQMKWTDFQYRSLRIWTLTDA